jgi:hypothetical protein
MKAQGFIGLISCVAIAGCGGTHYSLDAPRFNELFAQYKVDPNHKAMYVNTVDFVVTRGWNYGSPEEALNAVKAQCEQRATGAGVDPSKCTPVAVDESQYWDPSAQVQADLQQQQQDQQTMQQLYQSLGQVSYQLGYSIGSSMHH